MRRHFAAFATGAAWAAPWCLARSRGRAEVARAAAGPQSARDGPGRDGCRRRVGSAGIPVERRCIRAAKSRPMRVSAACSARPPGSRRHSHAPSREASNPATASPRRTAGCGSPWCSAGSGVAWFMADNIAGKLEQNKKNMWNVGNYFRRPTIPLRERAGGASEPHGFGIQPMEVMDRRFGGLAARRVMHEAAGGVAA